jgi:hypothetical protein
MNDMLHDIIFELWEIPHALHIYVYLCYFLLWSAHPHFQQG